MPCLILDGSKAEDLNTLRQMLNKRSETGLDTGGSNIEQKVRSIMSDVKQNGLEAVIKYNREFDCKDFTPAMFKVSEAELAAAANSISAEDRKIIIDAAANIRAFHEPQKLNDWFIDGPNGSKLGQAFKPVQRAGLYVPGGKGGETPLISSMLMTAIPALVAGVKEIAVITPPRADGSVNTYILAAASLLGISEVYACGSAWGISALVYGAGPLKPVDVIAGPGNIWVTTAKRLAIGTVGIDMIAGPSEIAIIADHSANPAVLAADMLGQAEHDPLASSICIVTSKDIIPALTQELKKQCVALPRAEIAASSLKDWGAIVYMPNLEQACELSNEIAPEHLELMCNDAEDALKYIKYAGSIFVGHYSAEALGDYFAGPNHVLPTMGTARFASGLGVQTFITRSNIINASAEFARNAASSVARLARLEALEGHARSAEARK